MSTTISPAVANYAYASTPDTPVALSSHESFEGADSEDISFTTKDFFDAMEEAGYNAEDYLSKEEIDKALEENETTTFSIEKPMIKESNPSKDNGMVSVMGGITSYTKVNETRFNLHLNSYITALIVAGGVGAASAALLKISAVASALSGAGIKAGALNQMFGAAKGMIVGSATNGITLACQIEIRGLNPIVHVRGVYMQP